MKNNDVQLIHRILDGDDNAFAELVEKYQKQVHALVWRKIGDFHIAEEITQDTFLKAYQRLATLKKPQRFASWLYVIATNRCSTWLRKKHLRRQLLEGMDVAQPEKVTYSEHVVVENEQITIETQRNVVKKLLAKLEESERTVMTLHYFGEMSCTEIGAFLGVSANTIKSRLHRAQQRLQKEETMIREALDNFKITPNLTETIMREVSRIKPDAPSGSKPLVPWAIAASTLAVVLLILGFGNSRYLTRFQEPYNFDATAEMTVDIIDAPIVANLESAPDVRTQIKNTNALAKLNDPEEQPNDDVATLSEETQMEETVKDYTQWHLPKAAKARLGKGGIRAMQFSPDGKQLAVGSDIGVWLYAVKTGKEVSMFPGICQSLAFSPDGHFLANGGGKFRGGGRFRGKELQLWEIATGRKVSLTDGLPAASVLRFSEDGKTLVSLGSWGDTISRLDMDTRKGKVEEIEERSSEKIKSRVLPEPYALTQDKFAVGGWDGKIELWDMAGKKLSILRGHAEEIQGLLPPAIDGKIQDEIQNRQFPKEPREENIHILAVAFSPDGTLLASGSRDKTVRVSKISSEEEPITLRNHTGWVNVLTFSPDGKILASGSTDNKVLMWDTDTGKLLVTLIGHINGITALTFSPDGSTLASASIDGTVLFWNTKTRNQLPTRITGHTEWVKAVAFLKESTTFASVAFNGVITLWDVKTSQKSDHQIIEHPQDTLTVLAFSPDGTKLASFSGKSKVMFEAGLGLSSSTSTSGGLIRITDVSTGKELETLMEEGVPWALTFSPDGKTVAFGTWTTIWLWNLETGVKLDIPFNVNGLAPGVQHLVFSPDGKKLVSGTSGDEVQMWDVETGDALASFTEHNPKREVITALAFSSDGALLAVGSNKRIRVMGSNKQIRLKEVPNGVETLVFAPDSTVLVSGLRNGEIELWNLATGNKLTTLDGHSEPVETLVFSPDGKTLVSTGQDGTILLWDWDEVLKGLDQ